MEEISKLLKELSNEEKAALVAGTDFMYTNPIPRLNIPQVRMSDGPHGLRVQQSGGDNGVTGSEKATAFPTASLTASSWNEDNLYKMGKAIAEEAAYYGVDVVLGPGTNIKRNPLCGRNFEYFSEDPLLAGKMASAEVKGLQENGTSACVKHFALNNSENYRFMGNSICDMRAIREIYLKPFEIIVKESHPLSMMCSYNKINGIYACQNEWLLHDVLRDEWGYDGLLMTDWGATHDRIKMLQAGLDLEMPGDTDICRKWIIDGIKDGSLAQSDLDKAVKNVLTLVEKHESKKKASVIDFKSHHRLAAEIAADSAVLMKNNGSLPLKKDGKYCVFGELFEKPRYQGSGSSMINPAYLSTPKNAFDERKIHYVYKKGYRENEVRVDKKWIDEALETAKNYDQVLLFLGLTDYVESEGADRENMRLPENQIALVEEMLKARKKVIVILYGGAPVELPFSEDVEAILNMYLPGQNGGEAMASLLFGEKNPSGKLAETWWEKYSDIPFHESFGKNENEVYKESVFVGYRYSLTAKKKVRFPFGYGLSYTSFEYRDMTIEEKEAEIILSCEIANVGKRDGAEVAELYVSAPESEIFKPLRELKGFKKVYLKSNETKRIFITIRKEDLHYWNTKENRFILESGEYDFQFCSDCMTIQKNKKLFLKGEDTINPYPKEITSLYKEASLDEVNDEIYEKMFSQKIPSLMKKKPIRLESRFSDLNETWMGRILFKAVLSVATKERKKALKLPEGTEKDNKLKGALFLKRILESNSIVTMSMSAGKSFPYHFAQGFVDLSNGHILRGIKDFCSPAKVGKLPKDQVEEKKETK